MMKGKEDIVERKLGKEGKRDIKENCRKRKKKEQQIIKKKREIEKKEGKRDI